MKKNKSRKHSVNKNVLEHLKSLDKEAEEIINELDRVFNL